ncbi:hypothetical protein GGQ74_001299 [Desulfobaculum xiamenense]|uniref:Uncharacterized protein n=1 Tax=Desulfobaculum xiamenense TaxID=995050 RepID=A0A846QSN4_9BACT|nr:hypothetical protein [Desulfobaculum xiamenense]NJB67659.1 hypothetical protein [Desulfobaculum xiamenense]
MGLNISYKRLLCSGTCGRRKLLELLVTTEEGSYSVNEGDIIDVAHGRGDTSTRQRTAWREGQRTPSSGWEPDYEIVVWQGTQDSNAKGIDSIRNRRTLALPETGLAQLGPGIGPSEDGPSSILDRKV